MHVETYLSTSLHIHYRMRERLYFLELRSKMWWFLINRGVNVQSGMIFGQKMSEPMKFSSVRLLLFSKKKLNQTIQVDSVDRYVFHAYNILKYFRELCFPCYLFFKLPCITNMKKLTSWLIPMAMKNDELDVIDS